MQNPSTDDRSDLQKSKDRRENVDPNKVYAGCNKHVAKFRLRRLVSWTSSPN